MKKILATILSVVMLFSLTAIAAFAEDGFPNPWELEDFGQKHYTLYINDGDVPAVDGKVNEGEYALVIDDLAAIDDVDDDRIFLIDSPADGLVANIYMDYDGDYYYLAVVVNDPEIILEGPHNLEGIGLSISADKEKYHKDDRLQMNLKPTSSSGTLASEVVTSIEGNTITYEMSIDKFTLIDEYGLDELEHLYMLLSIADETSASVENDALWNSMFFGFRDSDASGVYPPGGAGNNRFPHVITFINEVETEAPTAAPETDAPATEAPATDAPATDDPITDVPVKSGCGASVAAMGVALVAALGTCTVFVSKKR